MIGKIKKVKDELGNYFFPLTSSKAVVMEDGDTRLDDKLVDQEERIANWETFKASGGEIGGSTSINGDIDIFKQWAGLRLGGKINESNWGKFSYNTDHNVIEVSMQTNGTEKGVFQVKDGVVQPSYSSVNLGKEELPWGDIWLNGVSKNSNGYTKLPNGMIMQWGIISAAHIDGIIAFPIAFTSRCLTINTQGMNRPNIWTGDIKLQAIDNTSFRMVVFDGAASFTAICWIAIGY